MKELIEQLARENPVVHNCLTMHRYDRCTYEESLIQMVVALAAVNKDQQETLVRIASRMPYSFTTESLK